MKSKGSNWPAKIVLAVLVIILVVLCVFLVRQYRFNARQEIVSSERVQFANFVRHHSLGSSDVSLIEPWMTFDYVSVSFKVPTGYLMDKLGVASTTPHYPNVTLARYARIVATSTESFAGDVRDVVRNYLSSAGK